MNGGSKHLRNESIKPEARAEKLTGTSLSTPTHSYNLRSTPVRCVLKTSESHDESQHYYIKSLLQAYIEEKGLDVGDKIRPVTLDPQALDKKPIRARTLFK